MNIVRRSIIEKPAVRATIATTKPVARKVAAPVVVRTGYSLPSEPSEPVDNLGAYTWLIYGQKKIGKTSLAAQFPDALFMMFEPGGKALRISQVEIATWKDALGYLDELEKAKRAGALRFKTIVIDTGFEAYAKALAYICEERDIEYPREDNYGKDWNAIKLAFRDFHNRIFSLSLGVVVLCHEGTKEQLTYTGNKFNQVKPLLSNPADDYYRAVVDNVCWYHYRGRDRFLLLKGNDFAMAGCALAADRFFKTPSGEPVHAIPMGDSPLVGWRNIQTAFANQQKQSFREESEKLAADAIKESVMAKLKKDKGKR